MSFASFFSALNIPEILAPRPLLTACRALPGFEHEILGQSHKGQPIEAFHFGAGSQDVLFYGFPDPGEAIGATGILALMQALSAQQPELMALDLRWHFIPCLNFDDQIDDGNSLSHVRKTAAQEVDWILHQPRPETTALVQILERYQPVFTYPLHDEYHLHSPKPVYFPVAHALSPQLSDTIRQKVQQAGFEIDSQFQHPQMGAGFFEIAQEAGEEYSNSTFSVAAQSGQVFICELYKHPELSATDLVKTQLEVGFEVLHESLQQMI